MAIVQPSALVGGIKGKMAGSVFQNSANGIMLRTKPSPVGRGTNQQSIIKTINNNNNYAWQQLSDAQRTQWAAFANFQNRSVAKSNFVQGKNSGKLIFMSINFYLVYYGVTALTAPSFTDPAESFTIGGVANTGSALIVNTNEILATSTDILVMKLSAPQRATTNSTRTNLRTMRYNMVNGVNQTLTTPYTTAFGRLAQVGERIWVEIIRISKTGVISSWDKKIVTVV